MVKVSSFYVCEGAHLICQGLLLTLGLGLTLGGTERSTWVLEIDPDLTTCKVNTLSPVLITITL